MTTSGVGTLARITADFVHIFGALLHGPPLLLWGQTRTSTRVKVRGGVYFEAGFAMALQLPVIWTCSKESISDLHFDTRQYNHIVWEAPENLRELLKARIGAVIGTGPLIAPA